MLEEEKNVRKENWKNWRNKLRNSWEKVEETFPEAQRTQGIDSVSWVISKVEMKTSCRDYSRYRVNTLGPLCLWQCFFLTNLTLLQSWQLYKFGRMSWRNRADTDPCIWFEWHPDSAHFEKGFQTQNLSKNSHSWLLGPRNVHTKSK